MKHKNTASIFEQDDDILAPDAADVAGFDAFAESYKACFVAQHGAVDNWK